MGQESAISTVAVSAVLFVKIVLFAKYLVVALCHDFGFQNLCVEPSSNIIEVAEVSRNPMPTGQIGCQGNCNLQKRKLMVRFFRPRDNRVADHNRASSLNMAPLEAKTNCSGT